MTHRAAIRDFLSWAHAEHGVQLQPRDESPGGAPSIDELVATWGDQAEPLYVHIDCEFVVDDFSSAGLVSMALHVPDGAEYYAVNAQMDQVAASSDWMGDNVWPHLPQRDGVLDLHHPDVKSYDVIRDEVSEFFRVLCAGQDASLVVRPVVNCGAQDMARLHGLWHHRWGEMPAWIPRSQDDLDCLERDHPAIKAEIPPQDDADAHHALYDARHQGAIHDAMRGLRSA